MNRDKTVFLPLALLLSACATSPLQEPTLALADAAVCGSKVPLARELLQGGRPAVAALSASVEGMADTLKAGDPLTDEQIDTLQQLGAALRDLEACL